LPETGLWLATLRPSRAKPEIRPLLILYQRECARVLFEHVVGERTKVLGSATMAEWKAARQAINRNNYKRDRASRPPIPSA